MHSIESGEPGTRISIVSLVIALCVAITVPSIQATITQVATFDEKVDNAIAIILGKCIKTEARFDPTGRWILTYATFNVEESLKGNAAGEVTIVTPGGRVNGIRQETAGVPVFHVGDERLIFLRNTRVGPMPLYFNQGVYNVTLDHHEKLIVPMPQNVMHIDTQRGMALSPADEPRTLDAFKRAVSDSIRGAGERTQMSAVQARKPPEKSIWTTLRDHKILVTLAVLALTVSFWQFFRR
jgi:hypothetical protein